jgi:diguanylate cyclase (GGDEF)-like protein/PAS domain S-box-containing protein
VALGVIVVAVLPAGPWRPAVEVGIYVLGVVAVYRGLHDHRPAVTVAWRAMAVALGAFAFSSAAETVQLAGVATQVSRALEGGLDVVGYSALIVAAGAALVTGRGTGRAEAWSDIATLLLAAGLAVVAFADGAGRLVSSPAELGVGLPLLSAVVVVAGVRLALPGTGRSVSGVALFVAGGLATTGYAAQIISPAGRMSPVFDILPLLAVAAVTLAARHRSMAALGGRPDPSAAVTTGRVIGLGAALLISPAIVLLWTVSHGGNGWVLGVGIGLLTGLALWRLGRLDSERDQAQAALAASEARLRVLLENAADVIAIVDGAGRISYASPAVEALLGRPARFHLGRRALSLVDPSDRARVQRAVTAQPSSPTPDGPAVNADIRLRHRDGGTRWVEAKVSSRVDAPGVDGWVVNLREVTDRKYLEEELRHRACTDPLTGLVNRSEFWNRLAQATAAFDPAAPPAVLFIDLDGFKAVNDTLGHAVGDELLIAVAGRLAKGVRAGDCVARLGGDEFAVLLASADLDRTRWVADRFLEHLREPLHLAGHTVAVTASVGGALAVPGDTPQTLLHRADTAMYTVKRHGKDHSEVLHPVGHDAPR